MAIVDLSTLVTGSGMERGFYGINAKSVGRMMTNMTWNEFKIAVDKRLADKGVSGDIEIWYVDFSFPDKDDFEAGRITVSTTDMCGLSIG